MFALPGCHKSKPGEAATATPPAAAALPTDVTPPPPVSQFREGDHWRSWGFDASGRPTNTVRVFGVRNGAWYELPHDLDDYSGARDARSFEQLKDPIFYPSEPYNDEIFATANGLLHRYVNGQWLDLPLGSTLTDQRGTVYKIDVRVTPYEADQLTQSFNFDGPTNRAIGENRPLPNLLPTADQLAGSSATTTSEPAVSSTTPATAPAPAPVARPPSWHISLRTVILVLLLGACGALLLRNYRARS
jgi:hypothetical protein